MLINYRLVFTMVDFSKVARARLPINHAAGHRPGTYMHRVKQTDI
jgi:hypothetical protein